jgi:hypothetical protein
MLPEAAAATATMADTADEAHCRTVCTGDPLLGYRTADDRRR